MKKLHKRLYMVLGVVAVAISLSSCMQSEPDPAVVTFLKTRPELGTATQAQISIDPKEVRRERVMSSKGRRLLFNFKRQELESVYDESGSKRVLIWASPHAAVKSAPADGTPLAK